uniref:Uncharacterized protein n=1 Tax=Coturnix japonica TaxID=93934 RepID=A0A8C2U8T9_COTJA
KAATAVWLSREAQPSDEESPSNGTESFQAMRRPTKPTARTAPITPLLLEVLIHGSTLCFEQRSEIWPQKAACYQTLNSLVHVTPRWTARSPTPRCEGVSSIYSSVTAPTPRCEGVSSIYSSV